MENRTNPNNLFEANDEEMVVMQTREPLPTTESTPADPFNYIDFASCTCADFISRLETYIADRKKVEYNFHGSLHILNEDKLDMQSRWEILRQWCNRGCQYDDEIVQMYKKVQSITIAPATKEKTNASNLSR